MSRPKPLKIDKDGKLGVSEAEVRQACIEYLLARWPGAQYIRTDASDKRRSGAPSHAQYTLDGVFVHPFKGALFIEWKRRRARTQKDRREGQAATEAWLAARGYTVIRMEDGLSDPIRWFQRRSMEW